MDVKLAVLYFADAASGASGPVELHFVDDHFELRAGFAVARSYTRVTRIDFLDPYPANAGQILVVIPTVPGLSSVSLSDDRTVFNLQLSMQNLLGGRPVPCSSDLSVKPGPTYGRPQVCFYFPNSQTYGFDLGSGAMVFGPFGEDDDPFHGYGGVLQQLASQDPRIGLNVGGSAPSPFEAEGVSNCAFHSNAVIVGTRTLTIAAGVKRNVLVLRRDYDPGDACLTERRRLGAPFDLPIPPSCSDDSPCSTVQYPELGWLAMPATPFTPEPQVWQFETGEFSPEAVAQFWQDRVLTPYVGGLRAIDAPLPISLMPSLTWTAPAAPAVDTTWRILWRTSVAAGALTIEDERLVPGGYLVARNGSPAADAAVTCTLPCLRTHDGSALTLPATLTSWLSESDQDRATVSCVRRISFQLTSGQSPAVPQAVRLGSLDLTLSGAFTDTLQFDIDFKKRQIDPGVWTPTVYLRGTLPVSRVAPGGQDPVPGGTEFRITPAPDQPTESGSFQRTDPIVIDAQTVIDAETVLRGETPAVDPPSFRLGFSELTASSAGAQQQQVVLMLSSTTTSMPTPRVLVLDREPFLVAMVTLSAAGAGDGTDSSLVGTWCNLFPEGPGWRLRAGASGFNLLLPPQAVGEAMVKDLTLTAGAKPIDYRFSPLLSAHLLATYFAQTAVEPGWNTRRVLGYAGQRTPGAPVDAERGGLSFELLYGLSTKVTAPSLQLSEMFARLGNFPGPLPALNSGGFVDPQWTQAQTKSYGTAASTWASRFQQLLARPGVLELWNDLLEPTLVLDDGVDYAIRKEAFYTGQPSDLAGGIGYAIDSGNIRAELTRPENLQSNAGRLVSPRFTALGGYGKQRAEFAKGKIIIDSHTSMGRLERLKVTLVGRIGNLYHHALHITMYERTVAASQQFYSQQPALTQIPLLRKTCEYVEILEDVRSYPESGATDPALAGFVQAAHFKTTKIYVDSAWGGDVGTIGWQVPLYRPGALPAAVYGKPHIALQVAVDPALGYASAFAEIEDPQKLCFYTDTRDFTTSDTDSWPVIPEIDWIDQPANTKAGAEFQEPSVEIGFGRFTYHMVESPTQVNLVAQRAKTAVSAKLKNVSMMRGQRQPEVDDTALTPAQRAKRIVDWWTATHTHLAQAAATAANAGTAGQAVLTNALQEAQRMYLGYVPAGSNLLPSDSNLMKDLGAFQASANRACQSIQGRLTNALNRLDAQKQVAVNAVLQEIPLQIERALDGLILSATDVVKDRFTATVDAEFKSVGTLIAPFVGDLQGTIDAIERYAGTGATAAGSVLTQLLDAIKSLNGELGATNPPATPATVQPKLALVLPGSPLRVACDTGAFAVTSAASFVLGDGGTKLVLTVDTALDLELLRLNDLLKVTGDAWKGLIVDLKSGLNAVQDTINAAGTGLLALAAQAIVTLQNLNPPIYATLKQLQSAIDGAIAQTASTDAEVLKQAVSDAVDAIVQDAGGPVMWANSLLTQQKSWIEQSASGLCGALSQDLDALKNTVTTFIGDKLHGLLQGATGNAAQFARIVQQAGQQVEDQLRQVASGLIAEAAPAVTGAVGAALQAIRAFGEPPHVPTMTFVPLYAPALALPTMAYRFTDALPNVDLTPARAVVQQIAQIAEDAAADVKNSLSQLGVSLPTSQLLDRFVPQSLENFDLRDVLPKFAGIDLSTLFAGVTLPSVANNTVQITHHVDPQTRRASLDAAIHIPLAGETSILDLGPVSLTLLNAEFDAEVHCEATVGQQVQQISTGQITGDWELSIAGNAIVTFTSTTLSFDSSGKLHFAISPANVRLTAVLQFLADIVNSFTFGGSGFFLHMTPEPLAVQCILDLPLPDMSAGAFGIQNLHFGALFELGVDANGFYLGVGANLARQTAPFILTVFILGGAGWMEAYLRYQNGKATGKITIGMGASAALALSLGPISGSVSIQFAIFAELAIGTGAGLSLGIMILVVGRVSLLGIVDANITLLLEAQYSSGGGLVGRGYVSVSIKICWCFTLNVHAGVQFTFGAAAKKNAPASPLAARPRAASLAPAPNPEFNGYVTAALAYVDMLAA